MRDSRRRICFLSKSWNRQSAACISTNEYFCVIFHVSGMSLLASPLNLSWHRLPFLLYRPLRTLASANSAPLLLRSRRTQNRAETQRKLLQVPNLGAQLMAPKAPKAMLRRLYTTHFSPQWVLAANRANRPGTNPEATMQNHPTLARSI